MRRLPRATVDNMQELERLRDRCQEDYRVALARLTEAREALQRAQRLVDAQHQILIGAHSDEAEHDPQPPSAELGT